MPYPPSSPGNKPCLGSKYISFTLLCLTLLHLRATSPAWDPNTSPSLPSALPSFISGQQALPGIQIHLLHPPVPYPPSSPGNKPCLGSKYISFTLLCLTLLHLRATSPAWDPNTSPSPPTALPSFISGQQALPGIQIHLLHPPLPYPPSSPGNKPCLGSKYISFTPHCLTLLHLRATSPAWDRNTSPSLPSALPSFISGQQALPGIQIHLLHSPLPYPPSSPGNKPCLGSKYISFTPLCLTLLHLRATSPAWDPNKVRIALITSGRATFPGVPERLPGAY